jgi:hypothetical protein
MHVDNLYGNHSLKNVFDQDACAFEHCKSLSELFPVPKFDTLPLGGNPIPIYRKEEQRV